MYDSYFFFNRATIHIMMTTLLTRYNALQPSLCEDTPAHRPGAGVDVDAAVEWIRRYAPSFEKTGPKLWRGSARSSDECQLVDSRTSRGRRSRNTIDFYRAMLDHFNPGWPPRAQSFVCSTSVSVAGGYSTSHLPHLVIPSDDLAVATVNAVDLWDTGIADLNSALSLISSRAAAELDPDSPLRSEADRVFKEFTVYLINRDNSPRSVEGWFADMRSLRSIIEQSDATAMSALRKRADTITAEFAPSRKVIDWLWGEGAVSALETILAEVYNYEALECSLYANVSQLTRTLGDVECWVSGVCLLVPAQSVNQIEAAFGLHLTNMYY